MATQFSSARHWSFHYLISTGIAVSNLLLLWGVFRLKDQNGERGSEAAEEVLTVCAAIMREAGRVPEYSGAQENVYHQIMRLKEVHYLALFSLIYVGVEVSIGGRVDACASRLMTTNRLVLAGWIVTFIEDQRGGGASAGYISSGFFGGMSPSMIRLIDPLMRHAGLMLGRILLMQLNRKVNHSSVYLPPCVG